MSALWTVSEVLVATGGRAVNLSDGDLTAVSIDSREIEPGALFVAIKGDVHDGHAFVARALDAGARAALVSETKAAGLPQHRLIVVPDALEGLRDLAAAARARSPAKIVAVTGSAGKTTTKEAIRVALSALGPTHASIRSFNNHWGVPLMLARLPRRAHFGVFELGMNHAGEIEPLARLVRPHIAVITTVAAAHLEFFASVEEIAAAKAEIFLGLEPGGVAILNADHAYLPVLLDHARRAGVGGIITYGFAENAEWRIGSVEQDGEFTHARIARKNLSYDLNLKVEGRHMVANIAAALAVAYEADGSGAAGQVAEAMARFEAPEGRGMTLRLGPPGKPLLLIDQSYNANSASMAAAMDVFARHEPPAGNKVLILGDMLELGPEGPRLHAELRDSVLATGATRIFLVGKPISALADALGASRVTGYAQAIGEIEETILNSLAYGDAVMVKGSKGVQLAGLVQKIRGRFT